MAGHFDAIGFEVDDEDALMRVVESVLAAGQKRPQPDGGSQIVWRDASGASMTVHLGSRGEVVCVTPSFAATSAVQVRVSGFAEDPSCPFCARLVVDVLDGDGDLVYPLATQLADVPRARAELAPSTSARLAPALFAESFALWTDLEAYESEQAAAEDPRFAAESLIPTGLFAPEEPRRRFLRRRSARPPEAQVLMTGVVEAVELRRNALAGRPFVWLAVRTFGATYEVVSSADAEHPARGNVIQGGYWVVSTLPD